MGISVVSYPKASKISTITVDADLDMATHKVKTNDIIESTAAHGVEIDGILLKDSIVKTDDIIEKTGAHGVEIDGLNIKDNQVVELTGIAGNVVTKGASDNLKNSHDAEVDTPSTGASYVKVKTMTFTNGVKGTLRVKFDRKSNNASYFVYGAVYKNGALLGTPDGGTDTTYQTFSEDIDVGSIAAGETLELWGKAEHGSSHVLLKNFRAYYIDSGEAAVAVNT